MELTPEQALKKGAKAHKAGKTHEADQYYTAILKTNPKHPDANHKMGVLTFDNNKPEVAIRYFKTALEENPKIEDFWLSYIDCLIKLDRMTEAKAVFDQAKKIILKENAFDPIEKELKPFHSKKLNTRVLPQEQLQILVNLYNQGQNQRVLNKCSQLLEQYPNHADLHNITGAANQSLGKLDQAIEAYTKAISLKPDYAEAYNNMGNALKDLAKLDQAIEAYTKAISLKPDYAEAYNNIGNALQDQGKFKDALTAYSKSLSIKPNYANAYYNMGNALKYLGKLEDALLSYRKTLSIKPDYAEAYGNMGVALQDQDKLEAALDAYTKALAIKPDYADAYYNMGNALRYQGKLEDALKAYENALSIKPDYAEVYNSMGITFKDLGRLEDALKAYKKALAIKSDFAEAYNNIGIALKNLRKLDGAIKAFKKALEFKPDYAEAQHILSSLVGDNPRVAPRKYVENLFDEYARNFETSLVNELDYKIPELIIDILIQTNTPESLGSVLDLGCGTGLLGPNIRGYCSKLEGIDLSNKMLKLASQKKVYDNLHLSDISEYLSSMPMDFDYYIALDVFIYIGDLTEIFRLIKYRSKKPGKLVFSTEHSENDGYHLLKTGRYSHSKSYIEFLCRKFNYSISHFSIANLRKEKGNFLKGGIYLLEFPIEI